MSYYSTWVRRTGDVMLDNGTQTAMSGIAGDVPIPLIAAVVGAGAGALIGGQKHRLLGAALGGVVAPVAVIAYIFVPWMHK